MMITSRTLLMIAQDNIWPAWKPRHVSPVHLECAKLLSSNEDISDYLPTDVPQIGTSMKNSTSAPRDALQSFSHRTPDTKSFISAKKTPGMTLDDTTAQVNMVALRAYRLS